MKIRSDFILPELKYKRILLKVSGEALAGDAHRGLDFTIVNELCKSIKTCVDMGVQIGLVIGAGNFWRGVKDGADKMQRSRADSMGMLGTVMNAIAVADALNRHGMDARVLSAVEMNKFAEYFTRDLAERYLNEGKVVLFAAGTGNPYFTTDTGAALRACEINAEILMKATNVDGVYDSDPRKNPDAKKFDTITYSDVLNRDLKVMDATATALCRDNKMPIMVFDINEPGCFERAVGGQNVGTTVFEEEN